MAWKLRKDKLQAETPQEEADAADGGGRSWPRRRMIPLMTWSTLPTFDDDVIPFAADCQWTPPEPPADRARRWLHAESEVPAVRAIRFQRAGISD